MNNRIVYSKKSLFASLIIICIRVPHQNIPSSVVLDWVQKINFSSRVLRSGPFMLNCRNSIISLHCPRAPLRVRVRIDTNRRRLYYLHNMCTFVIRIIIDGGEFVIFVYCNGARAQSTTLADRRWRVRLDRSMRPYFIRSVSFW